MVLNGMGAFLTWYLFRTIRPDPALLPHQDIFIVPIGFALVFGLPLAAWLWFKGIRYPLLVALVMAAVLGALLYVMP